MEIIFYVLCSVIGLVVSSIWLFCVFNLPLWVSISLLCGSILGFIINIIRMVVTKHIALKHKEDELGEVLKQITKK